jgi:hypothetical protein
LERDLHRSRLALLPPISDADARRPAEALPRIQVLEPHLKPPTAILNRSA